MRSLFEETKQWGEDDRRGGAGSPGEGEAGDKTPLSDALSCEQYSNCFATVSHYFMLNASAATLMSIPAEESPKVLRTGKHPISD